MATAIRTSAGKETASQTVARAKSMLAQTKAEGSKSYAGSSFEKAYKATPVVTPESLKVQTTPNLPEKVQAPVPSLVLGGAMGQSIVNGQYTPMPKDSATDTIDASNARADVLGMNRILEMAGLQPQQDQLQNDYLKAEKQAGIQKQQQAVNTLTQSLNSIVANRDANLLRLRESGSQNGVTEAVYGGQQQTINREAAIQALPVQAQLDAAQGNLEMAQSRLDKMFAFHVQDVQNTFNFKTKMVDAFYDTMDASEQRRATQLLAIQKEKSDMKTSNLNYLRDLTSQAIANGNTSVISSLGSIDPNSPTFEADVARIARGIQKPDVPTTIKRDTQVVDGNLVDMQTGEVIAKVGAGSTVNPLRLTQSREKVDNLTGILSNSYLSTAVGTNALGRTSFSNFFTGGKDNFIADVEKLRSSLTIDSLVNAKANGATFGALSEGELKLLTESASTLGSLAVKDKEGNVIGYKGGEDKFKSELDKINNFGKLDYILKGGDPADVQVKVNPDGTYWAKNSDGTLVQLQ